MGLFNVVAPCVVEGKHYVRPTVLEFDDGVAEGYVESGVLTPYRAGFGWTETLTVPQDWRPDSSVSVRPEPVDEPVDIDVEPRVGQGGGVQSSSPMPKPRRRRKAPDGEAD